MATAFNKFFTPSFTLSMMIRALQIYPSLSPPTQCTPLPSTFFWVPPMRNTNRRSQKEGFDGSIAVGRNYRFRWRLAGRSDWSEITRQFITFSCLQICEARSQKVSELWWGLGALKQGTMWSLQGIEEPKHVSLADYKCRWMFSALSDLCSWFRWRIISRTDCSFFWIYSKTDGWA